MNFNDREYLSMFLRRCSSASFHEIFNEIVDIGNFDKLVAFDRFTDWAKYLSIT